MGGEERPSFPSGLLDWAGHRVGGVKRLFHLASGRPSGRVIDTPLLHRLTEWSQALARADGATPRVILLVGGPGNGKTEAVEHSVAALDHAFRVEGSLLRSAAEQFASAGAHRLVTLDVIGRKNSAIREVAIVQDASGGAGAKGSPPAELVSDLERFVLRESNSIYLACVNRGVLDDALMYATDHAHNEAAQLVERIIKSVDISPGAPACWPLEGYPSVGVWPMDVESLIEAAAGGPSPAQQLLELATDESRWPSVPCVAGDRCPFCSSRKQLSNGPHKDSLLSILRWYELTTGKRWTFRDLFSLFSYLLAGAPSGESSQPADPCQWAAELIELSTRTSGKSESLRLAAPYLLATSQYQHALFSLWPRNVLRALREDIRDLRLESHPALMGFYHFLAVRRRASLPATLEAQLNTLCTVLDPAVADPDLETAVSAQTTITLRDLNMRFSQSVSEGLRYIRKYQCLTPLEIDVLQRLDEADRALSESDVVNRRPATAERVQLLLRDFSCRFVRRSVGARSAVVRDTQTVADFHRVVDGEATLLHTAAKQVEGLLNEKEHFVVVLNTTFGEPLPPEQRRATLVTEKQKVKPWPTTATDRPRSPIRFLSIGSGDTVQSIPLTFELFRSVRELRQGMMPASLPRAVVALLDTTRAKLAENCS